MKTLALPLLILGALILTGCGAAEQQKPRLGDQTKGPRIDLKGTNWKSPVTEQDLKNFLAVVECLPNQQVPPFAKMDLDQLFASHAYQKQDIEHLRQSYRSVFDPHLQGENWEQDSKLVTSFEQMNIVPEEFAALVTKISLAWSASAIRGEIPILATQRKLREKLVKLEFDLLHPLPGQSNYDRDHQISAIRETVALSELLDLVSDVSDQSIQVMKANEELLHQHLPPARLKAKFEQCIESSPKVIRVGHSAK
jgi:hypothetical protein